MPFALCARPRSWRSYTGTIVNTRVPHFCEDLRPPWLRYQPGIPSFFVCHARLTINSLHQASFRLNKLYEFELTLYRLTKVVERLSRQIEFMPVFMQRVPADANRYFSAVRDDVHLTTNDDEIFPKYFVLTAKPKLLILFVLFFPLEGVRSGF